MLGRATVHHNYAQITTATFNLCRAQNCITACRNHHHNSSSPSSQSTTSPPSSRRWSDGTNPSQWLHDLITTLKTTITRSHDEQHRQSESTTKVTQSSQEFTYWCTKVTHILLAAVQHTTHSCNTGVIIVLLSLLVVAVIVTGGSMNDGMSWYIIAFATVTVRLEWANECVSERMSECVIAWVSAWVRCECSEWGKEWLSESVSQWVNEWASEWVRERVSEWASGSMSE